MHNQIVAARCCREIGAPYSLICAQVVTHVDCDLTDFDAVRKAAGIVAAATRESGLDCLCNNAGVMALADKATTNGYDIQMQTNHLSHFLLTRELHPALQKAVELRGEARIVNHSSFARNGPPGTKLTTENTYEYLGKNGGNLGGDGASTTVRKSTTRHRADEIASMAYTQVHDLRWCAMGTIRVHQTCQCSIHARVT